MLGLLIGRYRVVDAATDWLINALYATPLVAVIPLVILWLGLGDLTKLFIVTILAVFPVLINTAAGVRNVPQALIDVSTAFAANERQVFMKIILPSAVPYMMTGLRLGIGRAIIGMVVAEFFTAITGLGALIVKYGNRYDTASMFVPILMLMMLGILLTWLVRRAEEHFAPWRMATTDSERRHMPDTVVSTTSSAHSSRAVPRSRRSRPPTHRPPSNSAPRRTTGSSSRWSTPRSTCAH